MFEGFVRCLFGTKKLTGNYGWDLSAGQHYAKIEQGPQMPISTGLFSQVNQFLQKERYSVSFSGQGWTGLVFAWQTAFGSRPGERERLSSFSRYVHLIPYPHLHLLLLHSAVPDVSGFVSYWFCVSVMEASCLLIWWRRDGWLATRAAEWGWLVSYRLPTDPLIAPSLSPTFRGF